MCPLQGKAVDLAASASESALSNWLTCAMCATTRGWGTILLAVKLDESELACSSLPLKLTSKCRLLNWTGLGLGFRV
jgi:hypothetical protein